MIDKNEEFPTFRHVVKKSGNRTLRIFFESSVEDGNDSDKMLQGLVTLGCDYEGMNRKYVAINVPPSVDLENVARYLVEHQCMWEYADPPYSSLFPE